MKILASCFLSAACMLLHVSAVPADDQQFQLGVSMLTNTAPRGADALSIGNATVAAPGWSSDNPATLGPLKDYHVSFTATGGGLFHGNGPDIGLHSETLTINLETLGHFQIFHLGAGSGSSLTKEDFRLGVGNSELVNLMWGKTVAKDIVLKDDSLSVGLSFTPMVGNTQLAFSTPYERIPTMETVSSSWSVGGGVLYGIGDKFFVGASYYYTDNRTRNRSFAEQSAWTTYAREDAFKTGISLKLTDDDTAFLEYQRFSFGPSGVRDLIAGGLEHCFTGQFCLAGGYNGSGPTLGIGWYPTKQIAVNVSGGYGTNRWGNGSFGTGSSVMASINVSF